MFKWNTLIYIVIPVIHRNHDANDAMTTNIIHVMIPVIDRNYDITELISRNLVIPVIHLIYDIKNGFISWFRWLTGITMKMMLGQIIFMSWFQWLTGIAT
jgi:hypothetical protein